MSEVWLHQQRIKIKHEIRFETPGPGCQHQLSCFSPAILASSYPISVPYESKLLLFSDISNFSFMSEHQTK